MKASDAKSPKYNSSRQSLAQWVLAERPRSPAITNAAHALEAVVGDLTTPNGWVLPAERLVVVALDRKGRVLDKAVLATGSDRWVVFDTRHILRWAFRCEAESILVAHNHPDGDPEPSAEDVAVTRKLASQCQILDVRLLDHLVIGDSQCYVSMLERGLFG